MAIRIETIRYLKQAIDKIGGQNMLARKLTELGLPTRQGNISYWLKSGKVSPTRARGIELLTGVKKEFLRPDIYNEHSLFTGTLEEGVYTIPSVNQEELAQ